MKRLIEYPDIHLSVPKEPYDNTITIFVSGKPAGTYRKMRNRLFIYLIKTISLRKICNNKILYR